IRHHEGMLHVDVRVDASGHDDLARRIDDSRSIAVGQRARRGDGGNGLALDGEIALRHPLRGHHIAATNDQVQHARPRFAQGQVCTKVRAAKRLFLPVGHSSALLPCAHAGFTSPALRLNAAISLEESFLTTDTTPTLASTPSARCFVVASMALSGAAIATLKYSNDGALT